MGIFNWGKEVKEVGEGIGTAAESLRFAFTGDLPPEEKVKIQGIFYKLKELQNKVQMGAINLASIDAKSSSRFQSWWRPAIGWVAGLSLATYFLPQHIMAAYVWTAHILTLTNAEIIANGFPDYPITSGAIMELVIALLGMGVIRTVDKLNGTAK